MTVSKVTSGKAKVAKAGIKKSVVQTSVEAAAEAKLLDQDASLPAGASVAIGAAAGAAEGSGGSSTLLVVGGLLAAGGIAAAAAGGSNDPEVIVQPVPTPAPPPPPPPAPTYAVSAVDPSTGTAVTSVDEGKTVRFNITVTNAKSGTQTYTLSGVSPDDLVDPTKMSGSVSLDSAGKGVVEIALKADALTEATAETLKITVESASASVAVNDTSKTPEPQAQTFTLTTSRDTLAGGEKDDTFLGTQSTLQQGDKVTGGAGSDTLDIAISGTTAAAISGFDAVGVETVTIESIAEAASTVDFSNVDSSLTRINVNDVDGAALTLRDLQSLAPVVHVTDTDEVISVDYDASVVSGTADAAKVNLTEMRTNSGLTIDSGVEKLTITSDTTSNTVTTFTATGLNTLVIDGSAALTISNALDKDITEIDASDAAGALNLDVTASDEDMEVVLGDAGDKINFGNTLGDDDNVDGGTGTDTVSVNFTDATDRHMTMTNVETVNAIFTDHAEFDAVNVTGLKTVNIGLTHAGANGADSVDIDFNRLKGETATVNVYTSTGDLELDYVASEQVDLNLNLNTITLATGAVKAITIGDNASSSLRLINVDTVVLSNTQAGAATIKEGVDLSNDTTEVTLKTAKQGGNLTIGGGATALVGGGEVTDLTLNAVAGDVKVSSNGATDGSMLLNAGSLQNYVVTTDDADLILGRIGLGEGSVVGTAADELEQIHITSTDDGTVDQGLINASGADLDEVVITANDKNTISGGWNIVVAGLTAQNVDAISIDADDGGHVHLDKQSYILQEATFAGTGNIKITAGSGTDNQLTMKDYIDASAHTGSRTLVGGDQADTFYGSEKADTIWGGGAAADTIYGGDGGDLIYGDDGTGTVAGDGADVLKGDAGADTIYGGTGADVITGGSGNDVLIGGGDADTYVFAGTAADNGIDTIELGLGAGTASATLEDVLDFTGFMPVYSLLSETMSDGTSTVDADITNKVALYEASSAGLVDSAGEIAALIQESGDAFKLTTGGKAVLITGSDSGSATADVARIWYVDDSLGANKGTIEADDVKLVGVSSVKFDIDLLVAGDFKFA